MVKREPKENQTIHNIRIDEDDWQRFKAVAEIQGYSNVAEFVKKNIRQICREEEENEND